jgi:hypothetical protein
MNATLSAQGNSGIRRFLAALAHAVQDARLVSLPRLTGRTGSAIARERRRGGPGAFVPDFYGDARHADLTATRESFELYRLLSGHDNPE